MDIELAQALKEIADVKELIRKMIEAAKNKLDILQRGHHGK